MPKRNADANETKGNRNVVGPELEFAIMNILLDETDEQNPLKAKDVTELCHERYGLNIDKQAVAKRLNSISVWFESVHNSLENKQAKREDQAAGATEESQKSPQKQKGGSSGELTLEQKKALSSCVAVSRKMVGNSFRYYAENRLFTPNEMAHLFEMAGDANAENAFRGNSALEKKLAKLAAPSQRDALFGKPVGGLALGSRNMPDVFETLVLLEEAIERKEPINAYVERWHVVEPPKDKMGNAGARDVAIYGGPMKTGRAVLETVDGKPAPSGNDLIVCQWPYAIKFIGGHYYVLLNARNRMNEKSKDLAREPNNDDFRICRVDRLREVVVLDMQNKEGADYEYVDETVKEAERKKGRKIQAYGLEEAPSQETIDLFFKGSVDGMAHSRGVQKVVMRTKRPELVAEQFYAFEDFKVEKTEDDIARDQRDGKTRKDGAWYTVSFKAHPKGVAFWAVKFIDSVEIVAPVWARKRVVKILKNNLYGVGEE